MSLSAKLARRIAATGPITVAEFMTACLHDPEHGYYATRPAIGADGDFITAPMVSQMFGELIGLWAVECWTRLGRPTPFRLIELGPGDGTLMSDALRASARVAPDFLAAADLWLVEISEPLRSRQQNLLQGYALQWCSALQDVPDGMPVILIANELLDCLSARQFVRTERGWAERMIGLDAQGALAFGLSPSPQSLIPAQFREAPVGAILETSIAQETLGRMTGETVSRDGGAALFIDYGRDQPGTGDTLQALRQHRKVDPLATAGEADLTVHADFPAFAAAARTAGAQTSPIVTQAAFLKALGIEERASVLAGARPDLTARIQRQYERLVAPDQMGALFKVVVISSIGVEVPGF